MSRGRLRRGAANVFRWLRLGNARVAGKTDTGGFSFLAVKYNIEFTPCSIRPHRNLSADLITRCNDGDLQFWPNYFGMARIDVPRRWSTFAKFGNLIPCQRAPPSYCEFKHICYPTRLRYYSRWAEWVEFRASCLFWRIWRTGYIFVDAMEGRKFTTRHPLAA